LTERPHPVVEYLPVAADLFWPDFPGDGYIRRDRPAFRNQEDKTNGCLCPMRIDALEGTIDLHRWRKCAIMAQE